MSSAHCTIISQCRSYRYERQIAGKQRNEHGVAGSLAHVRRLACSSAAHLLASWVLVDVGAVDVVCEEAGRGNLFRASRADHRHEEHDEDEDGASRAHDVLRHCWRHQASRRLGGGKGQVQSARGEALQAKGRMAFDMWPLALRTKGYLRRRHACHGMYVCQK